MNDMINLIFKEDGLIKQKKSNYSPRESQIEAADLLLQVLNDKNHMILEGPCGFGKTYAYLIPASLYLTRFKDKIYDRIVIATNGISLSEQLIYQDLPKVQEILEGVLHNKIKFALMKGKGNFICKRKLRETQSGSNGIISPNILKEIKELDKDPLLNGDFTNLSTKLQYDDLSKVACVQEGECLGSSCAFYQPCHYQCQKKTAAESDIIVTNYHMLFSDQQSGGAILPSYSVLILDEAHELPNIARDFYCDSYSSSSIIWHRSKLIKCIVAVPHHNYLTVKNKDVKIPTPADYLMYDLLTVLGAEMAAMSADVLSTFNKYDKCIMIGADTQIPGSAEMRRLSVNILEEIQAVTDKYDLLFKEVEEPGDDIVALYNCLISIFNKIQDFVNFIDGIKSPEMQKKYAYYYEKVGHDSVKLCRKMIMVNDFLDKSFFSNSRITSCLLTSATLSINGGFEFIKAETGLSLLENNEEEIGEEEYFDVPDDGSIDLSSSSPKKIIEFIGQSPFDLQRQQLWFMSSKTVDGNKGQKYDDSMEQVVPELIESCRGGVLFLCTSFKNMNIVYDVAKKSDYVAMNNITVLKQGDYPNNTLVSMFEEDKNSILVASRSFFTGIDIPGDSLRCVAIDKFPFPSPGEPIMKKLEEIDKSTCFSKYSIPMMITLLKQAVGRGVRGIDDKCVIAFMDRRIKTAKYCGRIINSFPYEKTATKDANDIGRFLFNDSEE